MGYKLAGFDMLGGVEIDPRMSEIYVRNLKPRFEFLEGVDEFNKRDDATLPPELFDLDLLDGSPPCSSFSTSGLREKAWGKEKHFREGQAAQVLDSLPMSWVRTVRKLRPRVAIMENVTGMIKGDAKGFVREVVAALAPEYDAQLFKLNASLMGVAQRRERIFVIARRADLALPPLRLLFNEPTITLKAVTEGTVREGKPVGARIARAWANTLAGAPNLSNGNAKGDFFSYAKCRPDRSTPTLTATSTLLWWDRPELISGRAAARVQSFPDDYDFGDEDTVYVCGMSVPPLMSQRIALEIRKQWLG